MSNHVGRNDLCPCGSGKKYKQCCMEKDMKSRPRRGKQFYAAVFVGLLVVGAGAALIDSKQKRAATVVPAMAAETAAPGMLAAGDLHPQPPGPVPEGKVWSPEHGHWHNIVAADSATMPATTASRYTPGPQPDGPVPEGKVWSEEHGHWHNDPNYVSPPRVVSPAPAAEVTAEESAETPEVVQDAAAETVIEEIPEESESAWTAPASVDEAP